MNLNLNSKYMMIVTAEDERYGTNGIQLDFFSDNPWEGLLEEIVCGNNADEIFGDGANEGLFYQLYSMETRKRIGYGTIDPDCIREEIEEYEKTYKEESYEWKGEAVKIAKKAGWDLICNENEFKFTRDVEGIDDGVMKFQFTVKAKTLYDLFTKVSDYLREFNGDKETYKLLDESGCLKGNPNITMSDARYRVGLVPKMLHKLEGDLYDAVQED